MMHAQNATAKGNKNAHALQNPSGSSSCPEKILSIHRWRIASGSNLFITRRAFSTGDLSHTVHRQWHGHSHWDIQK